jgi:hypothetical protein
MPGRGRSNFTRQPVSAKRNLDGTIKDNNKHQKR